MSHYIRHGGGGGTGISSLISIQGKSQTSETKASFKVLATYFEGIDKTIVYVQVPLGGRVGAKA